MGGPTELLNQAKKAIDFARSVNIKVIYMVIEFRNGYPEISGNNKAFSFAKQGMMGDFTINSEATKIHSAVQPLDDDIKVSKRRVSAFSGSDLEIVLRTFEIDSLVLCGISTSGVILSTTREASDKDYKLTILKDACFNRDQEVHDILMGKVFTSQATVVTVDQWVSS